MRSETSAILDGTYCAESWNSTVVGIAIRTQMVETGIEIRAAEEMKGLQGCKVTCRTESTYEATSYRAPQISSTPLLLRHRRDFYV